MYKLGSIHVKSAVIETIIKSVLIITPHSLFPDSLETTTGKPVYTLKGKLIETTGLLV